jgi:hypothetical protein
VERIKFLMTDDFTNQGAGLDRCRADEKDYELVQTYLGMRSRSRWKPRFDQIA